MCSSSIEMGSRSRMQADLTSERAPIPVTVVGIGEDGWHGLGLEARTAIETAEVLVGSARQLALVPPTEAHRLTWPSPMRPFVDELLARYRDRALVVLASGDPMLHGAGALLARRLDGGELRVIPHVSAFALACARLGWAGAEVTLLSVVARPLALVAAHLQPGRRLIVFGDDGATPRALAALLVERGYGASGFTVLEHLGGPREGRRDGVAATWPPERCADLQVVAITCLADEGTQALASIAGLPDDAFESDGQLTKREVRAATLARLVPLPGQLLWDVGAGTGTIGIEWMRAHPSCRAIAVERDAARAARIARNAERLGVPGLRVVTGSAPDALREMEVPDAVFIGGGIVADGLVASCWEALRSGGRLVANAVTVEGEAALAGWHRRLGGELVRIAVSRAEPIGGMLCWRPLLPITQWALVKP
jgi:precorrin-6B C5,15-methyltransferase / cobalt-precorrin-6B C5,C15-methyltransferase